MVLSEDDNPLPMHLSQFLRQTGPFQIQVVRQLLTVKRNIKFRGMFLQRDSIQITRILPLALFGAV